MKRYVELMQNLEEKVSASLMEVINSLQGLPSATKDGVENKNIKEFDTEKNCNQIQNELKRFKEEHKNKAINHFNSLLLDIEAKHNLRVKQIGNAKFN